MFMLSSKLLIPNIAFIKRNEATICVSPGHPLFFKAIEEVMRLRGTSEDEDMATRLAAKKQAELDNELRKELGNEIDNMALQRQYLEDANMNLEKKKKKRIQRKGKLIYAKRPKIDKEENEPSPLVLPNISLRDTIPN